MSRYDVETLVRDAFRSREHETEDAQPGLVGAVRARVARRRRARVIAAGAGVLAVLAAAGGTASVLTDRPPAVDGTAEDRAATADWRWESSLGAEIRVPAGWAVNNFGCLMTGEPSVVRGQHIQFSCLTPEPVDKEIAVIGERPVGQPGGDGLPGREVTVDGVRAVRAEGRLPDGRYAGTVTVSAREVAVTVRTRSAATTRRILDSLRLVETDHAGCAARRPEITAASPATGVPSASGAESTSIPNKATFVPSDPSSIGVCSYDSSLPDGTRPGRLQASVRLTGAEATALAAALNAARPGSNPDAFAMSCRHPDPAGYNVLLVVRHGGEETRVRVNWNGCTGRGLDNGATRAQLTRSLLATLMRPLHTGYVLQQKLPD
ncbi:hypothetical protein [Micromonospora rubida]|uniref:hypothetical protein n=1 Tax=Micromonospora rubida TaxID=2697657 RepID=UPI001377AE5E|nr:hypothetical protein [Micromonospora rubida]NBE80604.1 hypothetical protein [Micromonospora rubida]